jgi:hypothetical protein
LGYGYGVCREVVLVGEERGVEILRAVGLVKSACYILRFEKWRID